MSIACKNRPIRENSIFAPSTCKISPRGRSRIRSNSPFPSMAENRSKPRKKHSASEKLISTTAKPTMTSVIEKPSTVWNRRIRK